MTPGQRSGPPGGDQRAAETSGREGYRQDTPYQLLPPLTDDEREALKRDIGERGVLVPVVKDQHGNILDGHHRVAIADELGIEYPIEVREVADEREARDVALTLNLARRHLTREQKRALIAAEIEARPEAPDRAIARRLQCSPSTVGAVRRQVSNLDTEKPGIPLVTREEAEVWTERIRAGLERVDGAILFALSNGIAPALIVGWLAEGLYAVEKISDDDDFLDPLRRYVINPRIKWVLNNGDEIADELGAEGPNAKPLDEDEIEALRVMIGGGA